MTRGQQIGRYTAADSIHENEDLPGAGTAGISQESFGPRRIAGKGGSVVTDKILQDRSWPIIHAGHPGPQEQL